MDLDTVELVNIEARRNRQLAIQDSLQARALAESLPSWPFGCAEHRRLVCFECCCTCAALAKLPSHGCSRAMSRLPC